MIEFRRFYAEHLGAFRAVEGGVVGPEAAYNFEGDWSFSGFAGGECVGCAGLHQYWPGRAMVWAFLSERARLHMLPIVKFAKSIIEAHPAHRIEAAVRVDFAAGQKFVRALGFGVECDRMRKYDPEGRDYMLFVRIK